MHLLLTETAHARVKDRLPAQVKPLILAEGAPLPEGHPPPEAAWFSLDLFGRGQAAQAFFAVLFASPDLKWLQSGSAGIDNPAFKAVMQKGVRITRSDAQAPSIAEYVMAHALSVLHPIDAHLAQQRQKVWKHIPFREIADTRWLIVGYGNIGQEIAKRLKPFGAAVTALRRNPGDHPHVDAVIGRSSLLSALPEADVVVLSSALNDETRDMADAAFFAAMKPGALFLNVGRGELVVEDALRAALDDGRVGFAVLDVFRTEPLTPDAWFWDHPKVRVTPHDLPVSSGLMRRVDDLFIENLQRYLAGEPLRNEAEPREVGLYGARTCLDPARSGTDTSAHGRIRARELQTWLRRRPRPRRPGLRHPRST